MVPIGIVTRNRVTYLDVTLRSLSGTHLPANVPVVVFDDASDDRATVAYLHTDQPVTIPRSWPEHKTWRSQLGLGVINDYDIMPKGIKNKVKVERLSPKPLGVVEASCEALRRLRLQNLDAPGVILLQDDVVFNADWYTRMVATATMTTFPQPLGVLAGIKINHDFLFGKQLQPPVLASGITAQCLFVTHNAIATLDMFNHQQREKKEFDTTLRRRLAANGFWAGVMLPFVCQHFGVQSMVRPKRTWHRGARGRVGYYSHPPYTMTREVKQF